MQSESEEKLKSPFDRRSGIDRRGVSYVAHIPERRSGRVCRISDDLRKELNRTSSEPRLLRALYGNDHKLTE
jgi:hypothetical protein